MKKVYLLDTNIISEFSKKCPNKNVITLYEARKNLCAISAITWQELIYGFERMPEGKRKDSIFNFIENLRNNIEIIPYDDYSAKIYGQIAGKCSKEGKSLSYSDTQIASSAIANGMVLVTHNVLDFKEIANHSFLTLEDWFLD
jgi:predicted nucleic acid-binding protein